MHMNYQKLRDISNSAPFQALMLSIFILGVFWNGLWGGAPRADQLLYLHVISQYQSLWDILVNSPALNRTESAGDFMLYRPILYLQLGIFYYYFEYNFFYWQLASLTLHIFVIIGLYLLFRQGRLKNTLYPLLLSAFFGVSFLSSELVLWNHISGYITFAMFSVYSVLCAVKFIQSDKLLFGITALILGVLAEFTYELGVAHNGLIAIVLIYSYLNKSNSAIRKKKSLVLSCLFISATLLYPTVSILDLTLRGLHIEAIGSSDPIGHKLLHATWFSFQQLSFWIGGWIFPTMYDIHAGGRSSFNTFNLISTYSMLNYFAIVFTIGYLTPRNKKDISNETFSCIGRMTLYALPAFVFLICYSFVIAYGRALPRGIDYVLDINIYYQYIACLAIMVMIASVFFRNYPLCYDVINRVAQPNLRENHSKHNLVLVAALATLVFFNASATNKLATEFRYVYSPTRIEVINSVRQTTLDNPGSGDYFLVDSSCSGNDDLPWFGRFRKGSGWSGDAHYVDVLFPEKSWELNKYKVSENDANVVIINCTKVHASSTLDNYGPLGLTSAANPGWHAKIPIVFPQTLYVDFGYARTVDSFHFLPQQGLSIRAPKNIVIEASDDHTNWKLVYKGELGCESDSEEWRNVFLKKELNSRYVRINILSNCGDPSLLTLRGLRFN